MAEPAFEMIPPTVAPALEYAARAPGRRRMLRRLVRLWPAWLLLLCGVLGVAYGPRAWRHYRLCRLQEACMAADLPAGRAVYERERGAARALAAAHPGEYALDSNGGAERVDPRWTALAAEIGVAGSSGPGTWLFTNFCHERLTPDGRRRLVVVENLGLVTVIEPAGRWSGRPRVVRWQVVGRFVVPGNPARVAGGIPDAVDRSRFTVSVGGALGGVGGTLEYRLGDDDAVTVRWVE